jgi:hypothetical protein
MDYKNGTQGHESKDNDDNDQLLEIDVLGREEITTNRSSSIGRKDDLPQRMAEQTRTIRELTQQLQQTQEELNDSARNQYELNSLLQAAMSNPETAKRPTVTPGPHRLQAQAQRPEDLEYQEKVRQQSEAPPTTTNNFNPDPAALDFLKILAQIITQHNQHDLTEPAKFNVQDQNWDEFYNQLRSYLTAKNWLNTFDHPTGPGTKDFDSSINTKSTTS